MKQILVALATMLLSLAGASPEPPARPKIYGIAFVRFKATDVQKSSDFYSRIIGLTSGHDGCKGASTPCFVVNPHQYVELTPVGAAERGSFLDEVAFTTGDLPKMRDYLSAHKVKTTDISRGHNGLRFFETEDPEHNRIAFIEQSAGDAQVDGPHQIGNRLFHAGFVVKDLAAENKFYRDLLGFRLYWYGGFKDADTDWYEIQVPDGGDWIEYMLNIAPDADHKELGVQNHFSLGVKNAQSAAAELRARGLSTFDGPEIGRDGKSSLDAYDPDGSRVEVMEFTPAQAPCCHPYTAPHPKP